MLFVGNSYTSVNDLPAAVRALGAATPGGGVEVESITKGGARLSDHWATPVTRARIAEGAFDAVVLQGQSVEPVLEFESFDAFARLFSDAMKEADVAGVWFATWARREGDPIYAALGLGDPVSMARTLDQRYRMVADDDGDVVARVGAAWELARLELPEVALHVADGSHPTGAGTLLAACVMLQALTGRTPHLPEPPPLGVDQATAEALCALAPRGALSRRHGLL